MLFRAARCCKSPNITRSLAGLRLTNVQHQLAGDTSLSETEPNVAPKKIL